MNIPYHFKKDVAVDFFRRTGSNPAALVRPMGRPVGGWIVGRVISSIATKFHQEPSAHRIFPSLRALLEQNNYEWSHQQFEKSYAWLALSLAMQCSPAARVESPITLISELAWDSVMSQTERFKVIIRTVIHPVLLLDEFEAEAVNRLWEGLLEVLRWHPEASSLNRAFDPLAMRECHSAAEAKSLLDAFESELPKLFT